MFGMSKKPKPTIYWGSLPELLKDNVDYKKTLAALVSDSITASFTSSELYTEKGSLIEKHTVYYEDKIAIRAKKKLEKKILKEFKSLDCFEIGDTILIEEPKVTLGNTSTNHPYKQMTINYTASVKGIVYKTKEVNRQSTQKK